MSNTLEGALVDLRCAKYYRAYDIKSSIINYYFANICLERNFPMLSLLMPLLIMIGFVIAAVFAVAATVITLYLAVQHLRNYTEPHLQRPIVRILLIVPIYAVASWLSLVFHQQALYFELVRGCYESYVIYVFFKLLVEFLGGEDRLLALFNTKPKRHHPPPCCCISYTPGTLLVFSNK